MTTATATPLRTANPLDAQLHAAMDAWIKSNWQRPDAELFERFAADHADLWRAWLHEEAMLLLEALDAGRLSEFLALREEAF